MPCGCENGETEWVFTSPVGQVQVFNKEITAKVAKIKAGGGTIDSRPKK